MFSEAKLTWGAKVPQWISFPLEKLWAGDVDGFTEAPQWTHQLSYSLCSSGLPHTCVTTNGLWLQVIRTQKASTFECILRISSKASVHLSGMLIIQVKLKDLRLTLWCYSIRMHLCSVPCYLVSPFLLEILSSHSWENLAWMAQGCHHVFVVASLIWDMGKPYPMYGMHSLLEFVQMGTSWLGSSMIFETFYERWIQPAI